MKKLLTKDWLLANIFPLMGILVGVVTIWLGFGLLDDSSWYMRNSMAFGGDFYTEIYGVVESIRGSLTSIHNSIVYGFGRLLICAGLTDICAFGCALTRPNVKEDNKALEAEVHTPAISEE